MSMGPKHRPAGPLAHVERAGSGEIELQTAADTRALGVRLGGVLVPGDLIVLAGPLGAGKTALTQGIGEGLGVASAIVSPTFVIARVHCDGRIPLIHVDAYRMTSAADIDDLDLDASFEDSVTVVEWGAGLVEQLGESRLLIELRRADDSEIRHARLVPAGEDWVTRLRALGL